MRCTVNATSNDFVPYFQHVIDALKVYLVSTETDEQRSVQIQAIGKSLLLSSVVNWGSNLLQLELIYSD